MNPLKGSTEASSLDQFLAEHPFLKGLDRQDVAFVRDCASEVSFTAGHEMVVEGTEANEFYLVREGKVALGVITAGHGFTTLQTIGKNDVLGWSWLMPPHQWQFGAKAITPVRAILLDGVRLRQKCDVDHDFGYEMLKRLGHVIAQRLRMARMQLFV